MRIDLDSKGRTDLPVVHTYLTMIMSFVTQAHRLTEGWNMQCGQIGRQAVASRLKHAVGICLPTVVLSMLGH
jgi:hypothetical protein